VWTLTVDLPINPLITVSVGKKNISKLVDVQSAYRCNRSLKALFAGKIVFKFEAIVAYSEA